MSSENSDLSLDSIKERLSNYRATVNEIKDKYATIETIDTIKTDGVLTQLAEVCIRDTTVLNAIRLDITELRLDLKQLYRYLSKPSSPEVIHSIAADKEFKRELDTIISFLDEYVVALEGLISSLTYRCKFYNAVFFMSK